MRNFRHLLPVLLAIVNFTVGAASFNTLTFVKTNGTTMAFAVDGLIITYDDFAHAVVTNNDTTATIVLADLDYMYFSDLAASVTGDVNSDGEVNISDINAVIDMILSGTTRPTADVNGDGEINISDINAIIDIILSLH